MRRLRRINGFSVIVSAYSILTSAQTQGAVGEKLPVYVNRYSIDESINETYLANRSVNPVMDVSNTELLVNTRHLLADNDVVGIQDGYRNINRDYDVKKNAGLVDPNLEQVHLNQLSNLSQSVINQIQSKQIADQKKKVEPIVEKIESDLKKDDDLMAAARPMAYAAAPVAFYFGNPIEFNVDSDKKVKAIANGVSQTGQLHFSTRQWTSSLILNPRAPGSRNPASTFSADPLSRSDEQYRFQVSRPIKELDLNTTFVYLSTSNVVNASVSKAVVPHVTVVLDSFYPLSSNFSDIKTPGNTVKAQYELHF